ncbi:MAG: hypothetical protein JHD16_08410 [Solirubrobacteraceae bacterium]|nr:hypothetical protein [Solirubrobacteraceae bacterium]
MSSHLPLAAAEAGGGAPIGQLAIVATVTTALALWTILTVLAYRRGEARRLRRLEDRVERLIGLPGWAALPGAGAVTCALVIILGATWDIGLHLDVGRDDGPLGTLAHYPLLFGLFGGFIMGILAIGMAPRDASKSSSVAFKTKNLGPIPVGSALLVFGATFGMAAFPLDDLWHRFFGQDVTLWGPTHTMIIGGTAGVGIGGVLLLIEGALAAGRNPFRANGIIRRPLPALLAGVFLYLWAATTHEFNWGVPQYRMVWQPLLLAFGAAQALVLARVLAGRGGALYAILWWAPIQLFMSLMIGGPLQVTMPAAPLFIAEALIIEAIAFRRDPSRPTLFGAGAGFAVGTLGFAAEYGWSQLVMPIAWTPAMLSEGLPVAIAAGVAGGLVGSLMAQALSGNVKPGRSPLVIAVASIAVVIGLGINAETTRNPSDLTAAMTLSNVREAQVPNHPADEPQRVADLTVRFSDPSVTENAHWVSALGWQGNGRYLDALVEQPDGSWKTAQPVPLDAPWKTQVRVQSGRVMLSAPIHYPADPAVNFAGFPEFTSVVRPFGPDAELMQVERREDAPDWAWTPAVVTVLSLNLLIIWLIGLACVRIGRLNGRPATAPAPRGLIERQAESLLRTVTRRGGVHPV